MIDTRRIDKKRRIWIPLTMGSPQLIPSDVPGLIAWFRDSDLSQQNVNCLNWKDHLKAPAPACVGQPYSTVLPIASNSIQLLDGKNYLRTVNAGLGNYEMFPVTAPNVEAQDNMSLTWIGFMSKTGVPNANACLFRIFRSPFTVPNIGIIGGTGGTLNKIVAFSRSDNNELLNSTSIDDYTNDGFNIVVLRFDYPSKTLQIIFKGNIVSSTNLLQNTYTWGVGVGNPTYWLGNFNAGSLWNGDIGEHFYYRAALSNDIINKLAGYLNFSYPTINQWINI